MFMQELNTPIKDSDEANRVIDGLGGTVAVSELFEVTTGAVSQWRKTGIPKSRKQYLKLSNPELFNQNQK